jgi:NAD(P)-dependent dehydrogenase (short-subunit alcohol dehydrogenase family)
VDADGGAVLAARERESGGLRVRAHGADPIRTGTLPRAMTVPADLLRPGLLDGLAVALAGSGDGIEDGLPALGATVTRFAVADPLDDDAVAAAAEAHRTVDVLVCDLRDARPGPDGFHDTLEPTWAAVRAIANAAMIPGERGGKVTLVAPPAREGDEFAAALRAALENMARTLSIEWARYGIRTVTILPGAAGDDAAAVASLVAYLASPAGDYFSGCVLELA